MFKCGDFVVVICHLRSKRDTLEVLRGEENFQNLVSNPVDKIYIVARKTVPKTLKHFYIKKHD